MLEKPAIQDEAIIGCLRNAYDLQVVHLTFLPLGYDVNAAVYRAVAADGTASFVKLRRGAFDENAVAIPRFLSDQGIMQIIAPLATTTGYLWASVADFTVVVYPFVEGGNGYKIALSARQWHDFGAAIQRIHATELPSMLEQQVRRETFSAHGRERVKLFLVHSKVTTFADPVADALARFLQMNHSIIADLIERAEQFAQALAASPPAFVLCHADIHAGNLLIDDESHVYLVDWDEPILAPKERDLMFIGGAQGFVGHTAREEETLFYAGYGETQIDPVGLAYYRYERIIQDIMEYCAQLFLTDEGGEDRAQSLRYLMSNFLPGGTIERARAADPTWRDV